VIEASCTDLMQTLCGHVEREIQQNYEMSVNPGWVLVDIGIDDLHIYSLLSMTVCQQLLGSQFLSKSDTNPMLPKLKDVLSTQTICVTAKLGDVKLTLGDLMSLQVGDVIKIDKPITESLQIVSTAGAVVCYGTLGQKEGQLALNLVSNYE
jgi:flagellar motor switch/type III secretory pathway protein FliN